VAVGSKPHDLGQFRAGAPIALSLDLDDTYPADAPIQAKVLPSATTGDLHAVLQWVAGPGQPTDTAQASLPPQEGPGTITIPAPNPGCYRLTVSGQDHVEPVTDLVVVASKS
jgi:hypothetical protein